MLQRYIRALADSSVNVKTYHTASPWRRCKELTPPSDDAKKCQQAILARLPGMALGVKLFTKVHKHGNISKW